MTLRDHLSASSIRIMVAPFKIAEIGIDYFGQSFDGSNYDVEKNKCQVAII